MFRSELATFFLQDTKKKINLFTEKIKKKEKKEKKKKEEKKEKNVEQIRTKNELNKIIIFKYI